jgi:hypothetical protein
MVPQSSHWKNNNPMLRLVTGAILQQFGHWTFSALVSSRCAGAGV